MKGEPEGNWTHCAAWLNYRMSFPCYLYVGSAVQSERACRSWRVWAKQLDSLHENVSIEHKWTFCKLQLSGLYRLCGSGGSSVGVVTRLSAGRFGVRFYRFCGSEGSSVGVVRRLSAGRFGVRFPEANNKFCGLQHVQTSSGANLALFQRNRRYFPGDKAVEDWSWWRSSV